MSDLRVVITGAGPVTALGLGFDEFSAGLRKGTSAIGDLTLFDPEPYKTACAAEVREFDVCDYVESQQSYLDRSAELAFAAMHLAIADAELDVESLDRDSTGLIMGSAWGDQDTSALFFSDVLEKGPRFAKPFLFPHTYANTVISLLAMEYGLTGFHMHNASGAIASAQTLVQAYDLIRTGRQTIVLAGGYDSLSETRLAADSATGRLAGGAAGDEICAPFDKARCGTILGEGASILVVEELDHARKRGARIRGEITAAALAGNLADAIGMAGVAEKKPDCIIASANGSHDLDRTELSALLPFPAIAGGEVPVTALKSLIGETDGAAGALHVAAALTVIQDGFIPAIANLTEPEDSSPDFVMGEGRQSDVKRVIVNAMDKGGNAVCMAIEKSE